MFCMKTNFKKDKKKENSNKNLNDKKEFSQEEFEEYVSKSGAAGSFMIFRSKNKKDELGLDQL